MTALNAAMNAGEVLPTNIRIVRELQFLSPADAAAAQDVLELPGVASDWIFSPISPLPAGVTSGFTVTGPDGLRTTVYDVALVRFGTSSPVPMTTTRSSLLSLVLNPGSLNPSFATGMRFYTATVPASTTSVTLVPTVQYPGATVTVAGKLTTSGLASTAVSLTKNAVTRIPVVVTAPTGGTQSTYYVDVTRYTTSGFLRMRLGDALAGRGLAPHIYVSAEEALAHLGE